MYKHFVFISYKRDNEYQEWVDTIFYKIVSDFFIAKYNKSLAFKDTEEQSKNYGNSVSNFLQNGLIYSRCMIAVLTPPYFCQSDWCVKEFSLMKERADTCNQTLLFPVIFTNKRDNSVVSIIKESSPNLSNLIENTYMPLLLDEDKFLKTNQAFIDSADYNLLKDKIKEWLRDSIVPALSNPPVWNQQWETEGWLNQCQNNFRNLIDCSDLYRQPVM
jgi:hypothetical protein